METILAQVPWGPGALLAFLLAVVCTPAVRLLAFQLGAVARPKSDRWHKKPTAMLGGLAIFMSSVIATIIILKPEGKLLIVLGASAFMFALGLVDDFIRLKPYQKLAGQIAAAATVIYFGLTLPWTGSPTINAALTIFWLIGITNAINLLDNMDGLAAGVSAIAAVTLAANFYFNGQMTEVTLLAIFAATLVGFLLYNSNPATIFMGDCGSLFVGFLLASTSLLATTGTGGRSRSLLSVLVVPVLILFIPIFDTTLVTVVRKLSGRAASQGGRDHTSHRLVALGLSERSAVWLLYALAASSGALALAVRHIEVDLSLAAIGGFCLLLTLLGVYLSKIRVYSDEELEKAKSIPYVGFLLDLSYKRRVFEVLLDVVLVILSYYSAYLLLFGPMSDVGDWELFTATLPLMISVKIIAMLLTGAYRGLWRYISVDNAFVFLKATIVGSVASVVLIAFVFRFQGFSRTAFILDAIFFFALVTISRMAFRLLATMIRNRPTHEGVRVLIYGAGDAGEILLRELRNNRGLSYVATGFLDDDKTKAGKKLHGLSVFDAKEDLARLCERHDIDEIIMSTSSFPQERLDELAVKCETIGVRLRRMQIQIETVDAPSTMNSSSGPAILTEGPRLTVRTHGSTRVVDTSTPRVGQPS